ncbi:hypothetical protein IJG04_01655, partial [Candidatus Saccharibacteria bacterium]|nr:hypothetical protein [Candidatus Saccharibacteria bacterium]
NPTFTIGAGNGAVTITGKQNLIDLGYMQDLSLSTCQSQATGDNAIATDRRDGSTYSVRYINDACWMTQNLRITGTISSTDSNFSTNSTFNVKAADLKGSSYSYTEAQSHVADSTDVSASSSATGGPYTVNQLGVWYNYCAASAGTVCSQTQKNATEDICPAGWHLPSYNTAPGAFSGITSYSPAFSPIYGGYYGSGSLNSATTYGSWWSATASNASSQYYLNYYNGSLNTSVFNFNKSYGYYVRCVMKPPTIVNATYMQDVTTEMVNNSEELAEATLIDRRDGSDYTVKKINGALWMTQNLRFTGTSVPTATSNTTADKTLTYYQLDTNGTSGGKCYSTTGYSNACIKDSGNTTTGVWYNYYAATAGTVSGSSNSTVASQDICPKNWHLPTGPNTTSGTDFNKLVGNTTSGYQNPTTGLTAFGAVAGGKYYNGALYATGYGLWWSATADTAVTRYYLIYNSSNGQFNGNFNYDRYRYYGYFVRCVRSS